MLQNYFMTTIRNMRRNKIYAFINITGLGIGIACCIYIILFIQFELSYDTYIKKSDRIYRLALRANLGETKYNTLSLPGPLGKDMLENHSEVEQYVRFAVQYNSFISYGETIFIEPELALVDKNVFEVFEIPMISGDPKNALAEPNTICISEKTVKKYFGNENPIGKVVRVDKNQDFIITGVFKDFPENSHLDLTLLASNKSIMNEEQFTRWGGLICITYLVLKEGKKPDQLLPEYADKITKFIGYKDKGGLLSPGDKLELYSHKLTDIHLYSNARDEFKSGGDISQIYIFTSVAFFVLLIACINFINLSTAKSISRSKEIAIRKTVGSSRLQLIKQFLGESILCSFFAMIISIILIEIILPEYRNFIQKPVDIHYFNNIYTIPFLLSFTFFIGIISGLYPALYLTSFKPVSILKGKTKSGVSGSGFRNKLVIFQFTISIVFFIGTMVINNQLNYFKKKKLGFDRENVVVVFTPESYHSKIDALRDKLLKNSSIISVTNSHSVPGTGADFTQVIYEAEGRDPLFINTTEVDYEYLKTLGFKMVQGRFFSKEYVSDSSSAIVINESAAKYLGWTDPIGKTIRWSGERLYSVIGVIKDFNFESLHKSIKPMALVLNTGHHHWLQRFISVRFSPGNIEASLEYMKSAFKEVSPSIPFIYTFLDERYNMLYKNEHESGRLFSIFSFLAILVACLGLLGLITYATEQRTKEVAIRKVLGAKLSELFYLLSKESIKWVILANIIAWPAAYYLMNKWLESFAYKINLGIWEFILSGLLAFLIAIFTVSFQVAKVIKSNPVESLKYE